MRLTPPDPAALVAAALSQSYERFRPYQQAREKRKIPSRLHLLIGSGMSKVWACWSAFAYRRLATGASSTLYVLGIASFKHLNKLLVLRLGESPSWTSTTSPVFASEVVQNFHFNHSWSVVRCFPSNSMADTVQLQKVATPRALFRQPLALQWFQDGELKKRKEDERQAGT